MALNFPSDSDVYTDDNGRTWNKVSGVWRVESTAVLKSDTSAEGWGFVSDDDALPSSSDVKIPTARSIRTYVGTTVTDEIAAAVPNLPPIEAITRTQTIEATSGANVIDLSQGTNVHVVTTDGTWTPTFVNAPSGGVVVNVSINVTNNDDEPLFPGVEWHGDAPVEADWKAGETNVIRLTKLPFVDKWIAEWVLNIGTPDPDPEVTPVPLEAYYSTSAGRTSPQPLESATLPRHVAVWFGPAGNTDLVSFRIFVNHEGDIPAVGAEGDSYVRTDSTPPYDMLGASGGQAIMWDTTTDPTGNARDDYNPNGETTITVEARWIDGQLTTETFTFDTSNAEPGAEPTLTHTQNAYNNATSSTTVTIPQAADRVVVVQAFYNVTVDQTITALTLNGVPMSTVAEANKTPAVNQGLGVRVGYLTEADLATGTFTLAPTYSAAPTSWSAIVYHVWVLTNVATPSFVGHFDYDNVSEVTQSTQTPTVSSPANAFLLTSSVQNGTTDATVDIGTATTPVASTNSVIESRASWVTDSGSAGSETATWGTTGRAISVLMAMGYSASEGGEGTTPVLPGVPTIASNVAGDNQLTVTWGAATDAVSYEIRWGQVSNPNVPAGSVFPVSGLSRVITGLAASVGYGVQVRSVSVTGHRSDWSAVSYQTPTGSVTPPPTFGGKFDVSFDFRDVMMGEGYGTPNFQDFWTQRGFRRVNSSANEWDMANIVRDETVNAAIGNWNARGPQARAFRNECGPRLIVTNHMAIAGGQRQNLPGTRAQKAFPIMEMGKSGSTGSINRDATWRALGANLNKTYSQGFKGYDVVFLSLAHESFGSWAFTYAGRNTELIGDPSLLGATNAQYGSAMAAALRKAGETGDCADVHRLAIEHQYDVLMQETGGKAIVGMTPNDGGGSDITGVDNPTNLSSLWVRNAFPDRPIDFLAPTTYLRGNNKNVYNGSGDINDPANWTFHEGYLEYAQEYVNEIYGCAFGLLELGAGYAVPSGPYNAQASTPNTPAGLKYIETPGQYDSQSDNAAYIFYKNWYENRLKQENFHNGFCFFNTWNFLDWVDSNHEPGCSFNLFEGMWGWHPRPGTVDQWVNVPAGFVGYLPTSTGKPNWSSVAGNTRYPKTLALLQSKFAVGV